MAGILDKTKRVLHLFTPGYACGSRVSEVINLKVADLDIDKLVVHIKNAKCRKDRISVLPEKLQNDLLNINKFGDT